MDTIKSVLIPLLAVVLWLLATCPAISQEIHNPKPLKSFQYKTEKHVTYQKYMFSCLVLVCPGLFCK